MAELLKLRSAAAFTAILMMATPLVASTAAGLRLSYSLAQTGVTVNEPILLKVHAENGLDELVVVDLGADFYGFFRATLTRPDGKIDRFPNPHEVLYQIGHAGLVTLAAHGNTEKLLLLNRWFAFDVPGRYYLALELKAPMGPPKMPDGSEAPIASEG